MLENRPSQPRAPGWALSLESAAGDSRQLGGLSLALRLALDAQAAGALAIIVGRNEPELQARLTDERMKLPVLTEPPENVAVVHVPGNVVVHRATFKELASRGIPGETVRLLEAVRAAPGVPYSFAPREVTDLRSARLAERALFQSLRKPQDGWTSRHLNRYISLWISRWLVRTPLRPNQLSVAILGVGVAGAVSAAQGGYWPMVLGAFLFQAQSVLDGCDGEMSRVSHRGSRLGEWLDTIGDDLTNYGFFAGAAVGLFRTTGETLYLVAGGITVTCGIAASGLEYRYLVKIGSGDLLKYPLSESSGSGRLALLAPLFKRDTFVLLTLLATLAAALGPMLCVFSLAAIGILASVIKTELRLAREARGDTTG